MRKVPVLCPIKLENCEGFIGRFGAYKEGYSCSRGKALVEEWDPNQGATDRVEGAKGRDHSCWIAVEADESTAAGVKGLRR